MASSSASARNARVRRRPEASLERCRSACCAYFGRSSDSRATIATRLAASAAATADALPPPGTGSDEASRSTNSPRDRSAKREDCAVASSTAEIVGGRRTSNPAAAERTRYRRVHPALTCGNGSGGGAVLVETFDRPPPGAVREAKCQPCARSVDLEHRARAHAPLIRRGFLANGSKPGNSDAVRSPRDLARTTVEPIGPYADSDRLDADHRHDGWLLPGAVGGSPGAHGDRTNVRLTPTLTRTGVRCQASARIVARPRANS